VFSARAKVKRHIATGSRTSVRTSVTLADRACAQFGYLISNYAIN